MYIHKRGESRKRKSENGGGKRTQPLGHIQEGNTTTALRKVYTAYPPVLQFRKHKLIWTRGQFVVCVTNEV